jgi:hypothetical protein
MAFQHAGILALAAALAAAGCSSGPNKPRQEGTVDRAISKTQAGLGDAALSPLNDLNMRRDEIPLRLQAIISPYEPIKKQDCVAIGVEVLELTNILGPDTDAPPNGMTDAQRTGDAAAQMALRQVSSTMSDFIPFRSLVREATGASAHERRLRAAYERGVQRRAYLKGVGAAIGCGPPAAPDPSAGIPPPPPNIEYRGKVQPGSAPASP